MESRDVVAVSSRDESRDPCFQESISVSKAMGLGHKPITLSSTAVKQTYCANCDKSMKISTVVLYIIKFIFRCGAIFYLTRGDLERSMTLDDENMPFSANCNNAIFSNLA